MAAAKFFSDTEKEYIKAGVSRGVEVTRIAKALGRNRQAVYKQIKSMRANNTLQNLPFDTVVDRMVEKILAAK